MISHKIKPIKGEEDLDFNGTMTWRYRIMRYKNGELGLHEAYYDDGVVKVWTQEPIIVGDTVEDILNQLEMMRRDILRKEPIIDYE